jgi:prolipoprotein diacylglyceryltransferase
MIIGGGIGLMTYLLFINKDKEPYMLKFAYYADKFVFPLLVWIIISRIGCFVYGHIQGKLNYLPWCIFHNEQCTHPVALYLSITALFIFIALWLYFRKEKSIKCSTGKLFDSELVHWFLILFFTTSFLIGFLIDEPVYFGLSFAQWFYLVCFVIIVIDTILLYSILRKHRIYLYQQSKIVFKANKNIYVLLFRKKNHNSK